MKEFGRRNGVERRGSGGEMSQMEHEEHVGAEDCNDNEEREEEREEREEEREERDEEEGEEEGLTYFELQTKPEGGEGNLLMFIG